MSTENCQICCSEKFKYSCPKCNILYCSVECYRSNKHQVCSEEFYRKCVQEELTLSASTSDEVQNMYNILKRLGNEQVDESIDPKDHDEIDSDDEDDSDLTARLQGVNIDDADEIWNRLTAEEKYEFESLVETGKISSLLPQFEPWWNVKQKKLIEDITQTEKFTETSTVPEIMKNIAPFASICKKEPSPCLWHNLCNILAAYTCTVTFFNGEHLITPVESTKYIYTLSNNLKENANYNTDEQAIESVVLECQLFNNELSVQDYDDNVHENLRYFFNDLLLGNETSKMYTLAALSDLWRVFTASKKKLYSKNENKQKTSNFDAKFSDFKFKNSARLSKEIINNLIKKIEYFLSFVNKESN